MQQKKTILRPLFWSISIFFFLLCVFLIILHPIIGIAILLAAVLGVVIFILVKPSFWEKVKPVRRARVSGTAPARSGFEATMLLESCLTGSEAIIIAKPSFTLGRAPDCDYRFSEGYQTVSSHHCRITFREATKLYFIEDLGSKNGTFVNSVRLSPNTPAVLKSGFIIGLDQNRYVFKPIER